MKKSSNFIYPFVVIFTLIAFSCDKNAQDDINPMILSDTILMVDLSNCDPDHNGRFTFEYLDSIYQFTNPTLTVYIDTIPGSSFFLSDSIVFYKKTIRIEAFLSEIEQFILTIVEVEDPFSACLPLKEYFESNYSNYANGLNYCFTPNPDNTEMTIPLCSSVSASLKTIYEAGVSYIHSSQGSLEVVSCDDGSTSGYFENELFKNGRFCNIKMDWR